MRIAVCIKWIASQNCLNPYDRHAIEAALQLGEVLSAPVTAFCMGPAAAQAGLREALAMGVDDAVLCSDAAFAGADVYATAYTLKQAFLQYGNIALVVTGQQSIDGDTAQLPFSLSYQLGFSAGGWVQKIHSATQEAICVEQELSHGCQQAKIELPAVLAVGTEANTPRIPSLAAKLRAKNAPISLWTLQNLPDTDPAHYGAKGSYTVVRRSYASPAKRLPLPSFTLPGAKVFALPHFTDADLSAAFAKYKMEIAAQDPDIVLIGATLEGRMLAPMLAAHFKTGVTADCTALALDETGLLVQTRPTSGGEKLADIVTPRSRPQMATLRTAAGSGSRVPLMLCAGGAFTSVQDLAALQALAVQLCAPLCCSRSLVRRNLMPHSAQIGLSGKLAWCDTLVTFGVSGATQFLAGLGGADTVISINTDPLAPLQKSADISLVEDAHTVIKEALSAQLTSKDFADFLIRRSQVSE